MCHIDHFRRLTVIRHDLIVDPLLFFILVRLLQIIELIKSKRIALPHLRFRSPRRAIMHIGQVRLSLLAGKFFGFGQNCWRKGASLNNLFFLVEQLLQFILFSF